MVDVWQKPHILVGNSGYQAFFKGKSGMVFALLKVIDLVFSIYIFILIASAIFSWLYAFNIVNPRNPLVMSIANFLYHATEPVLAPIRRRLPDLGSIDISPIIVFLVIYFIRVCMWRVYFGMLF